MSEFYISLPSHSSDTIRSTCKGALHPQAVIGIMLMNRHEFFAAHEALEIAWMDEKGAMRDVYRGILQTAVAYLHIQRSNYRGAIKMLVRCQQWLAPFPPICRGIDLERLREDIRVVEKNVIQLGPDGLKRFDPSGFKPVVTSPAIT